MGSSSEYMKKYREYISSSISTLTTSSWIKLSSQESCYRPTIKFKKVKRPFGHNSYSIYHEGSSGEDSEIENKQSEPTIEDVQQSIYDPTTIRIVKDLSQIPENVKVYLAFVNIEPWYNSFHMKYFLEELHFLKDLGVYPVINEIKIINIFKTNIALVNFQNTQHAEIIKGFFNHPNKFPTFNSLNNELKVFWAYDLLELKTTPWYCIIIRNIPEGICENALKKYITNSLRTNEDLTGSSDNIEYISNPVQVKGILCSLVTLKNLDIAERLCYELNSKNSNKDKEKSKKLKVNLHPNTFKLRSTGSTKHSFNYNKLDVSIFFISSKLIKLKKSFIKMIK